MSLNKNLDDANDKLNKAKKDLEKIRKEYEEISGLKAPEFNLDNLKNTNAAIETMTVSLEKAKEKADNLEEGWGGIAGAVGAAVAEMKRSESATNRTVKAMVGIRNISDELKQDQQGLRDLSLKNLQSKKDKLVILTQEAKEQAKLSTEEYNQVAFGKNNYKLSGAALTSRLKKLGISKKEFESMKSIAEASKEELKNLDEANDKIEERIKKEQEVLNKTGLIGAGIKSLQGFLSKAGAAELGQALGLDDANKKMRELAKEGASTFQILKGGFASIGGSIMAGLTNPLTAALSIFTFMYKKAMEADKHIGALAKGVGITYGEARNLSNEFSGFAATAYETGVTAKGMTEALTSVNAELGLSGRISNENLATMEKLNRFAGLNYQQQAQTLKTSIATGESYEGYMKNVLGTIKLKKYEQGLALNEKKIMLDINKAANSVKLSIAGGGKGLAEAAVAAAKLGVSLNKVDAIADSLLNFEQSIKNELDAELLTGKELNLEKARQAALNNDLKTVAEEITKQVGSSAEFSKMNRIQQEAMAKAVGMTKDELAGALIEQEALKNIGGQLSDQQKEAYEDAKRQYGAEKAAQMLKDGAIDSLVEEKSLADQRQAQQDKFNDTMMGLATALIPVFDMLFQIANIIIPAIAIALEPIRLAFEVINGLFQDGENSLTGWQELIGGIAIAIIGIVSTMKIMKAIQVANMALKKQDLALENARTAKEKVSAIIAITRGAWSSLGPIPFVGAGLAIAAIVGAIATLSSNMSKGDDIMSPGDGSSGYGKRTLFGPEGAIQLNNKDTVVAGTNLFGDDTVSEPGKATEMKNEGEIKVKTEGGGGGGTDMSSVVNAINALGARVDALASRPISVNVDGNKIIEATTGGRPIESGEAASKNSFQVQ